MLCKCYSQFPCKETTLSEAAHVYAGWLAGAGGGRGQPGRGHPSHRTPEQLCSADEGARHSWKLKQATCTTFQKKTQQRPGKEGDGVVPSSPSPLLLLSSPTIPWSCCCCCCRREQQSLGNPISTLPGTPPWTEAAAAIEQEAAGNLEHLLTSVLAGARERNSGLHIPTPRRL